jgi:hypothetical protein
MYVSLVEPTDVTDIQDVFLPGTVRVPCIDFVISASRDVCKVRQTRRRKRKTIISYLVAYLRVMRE